MPKFQFEIQVTLLSDTNRYMKCLDLGRTIKPIEYDSSDENQKCY